MFTHPSFLMAKYSMNSISFFFLFSRLLIGRKIKVLEELLGTKKCTCDLFLRSNKTHSGQNNQPESRRNESFLFFLSNKETSLSPHTDFPLATQNLLQTNFISREQWNRMISYLDMTTHQIKKNDNFTKIINTKKKWNLLDRFSSERTIWWEWK